MVTACSSLWMTASSRERCHDTESFKTTAMRWGNLLACALRTNCRQNKSRQTCWLSYQKYVDRWMEDACRNKLKCKYETQTHVTSKVLVEYKDRKTNSQYNSTKHEHVECKYYNILQMEAHVNYDTHTTNLPHKWTIHERKNCTTDIGRIHSQMNQYNIKHEHMESNNTTYCKWQHTKINKKTQKILMSFVTAITAILEGQLASNY